MSKVEEVEAQDEETYTNKGAKSNATISDIAGGVDLTCPHCNGTGKADKPATMGQRISLLREQRHLTRAQAATDADISASLWGKLEGDESENPSLSTVLAVAKALGVTVGQLLGE